MQYFIGIDLGGTLIKMGLLKGETIIDRCQFQSRSASGMASHLEELAEAIDNLLHRHGVAPSDFGGIGLSFAGIVDVKAQRVLSTNEKYDDAPGIDLVQWAKDKWGVQFFMDNDARMATTGEWQYGAGKGCDNMVMMTLGTGIGTSAIMEGRIVRGKHFQAGCLGGHFTINLHEPNCNCGNIGCVEALSSSWSIDRQAKTSPELNESLLANFERVGFLELFDAARKGDALACRIRDICLQSWATGVVNLIHAYDPERVILSGGAMNSKDEILPFIRQYVNRYAWTPWGKVEILASTLMNDAAILGVCYCLQNLPHHLDTKQTIK